MLQDLSTETEVLDQLIAHLQQHNMTMTSAESLTAGLISATMTARAGSSAWWDSAYVVYNNEAKTRMLGVSASLLDTNGAVDEQVAEQMAAGALQRSRAGIAVSVTGIAGPSGAEPGKPVGTVYIGVAAYNKDGWIETSVVRYTFDGDRDAIRNATIVQALHQTLAFLQLHFPLELPNSSLVSPT